MLRIVLLILGSALVFTSCCPCCKPCHCYHRCGCQVENK